MANQSDVVEPEADVANKSNVVNTRLNKLLETRFENDKVSDIIQLLIIYVFGNILVRLTLLSIWWTIITPPLMYRPRSSLSGT